MASARCTLTAHVPHASTLVTIAACVSALTRVPNGLTIAERLAVSGKCGHNFHMVRLSRVDMHFDAFEKLILFSTVSWNGLSKSLQKGNVPCAARVCFVPQG